MMEKRSIRAMGLGVAVLAAVIIATPASAAVVGITTVTWDPAVATPIVSDANLTSITAGGTTYANLTAATSAATVDSGTLGGLLFYSGTAPANGLAAVTDGLNATTGSGNIGDGVNFFFGQNVDGANLFFVDIGAADLTTVRPIDGAGNLIGDFTLSTLSGGGTQFGSITLVGVATVAIRGVLFNTSDFSGTGSLTGVEGIRLAADNLDPMVVGIAAVPEPSSAALLLLGTLGMAMRRRKN